MLEEYSFDDIYIRYAVDEQPDDKDFSMHIHDQCEIYFFISGNVEYLVEGARYSLDENSLMIMRPGESHKARIKSSGRYERYAINFPLSFADNLDTEGALKKAFTDRTLGKSNMFSAFEIDMKLVKKLFSEMCQDNSGYERKLTIKIHLLMLLDMIYRAFVSRDNDESRPHSVSERIVMYVNDHLYEELSVPMLAEHFYISPSQFGRLFRQSTGASPWEYITRKRLTSAKEMIRSGFSVQEASEKCGFGDYSSFYRAYVKQFGCAPTNDNRSSV